MIEITGVDAIDDIRDFVLVDGKLLPDGVLPPAFFFDRAFDACGCPFGDWGAISDSVISSILGDL